MLIVLMGCMSACSSKPCPASHPVMPPTVYLAAIPEPELKGQRNIDLTNWAIELRSSLRQANFDKMKLREWLNEHPND